MVLAKRRALECARSHAALSAPSRSVGTSRRDAIQPSRANASMDPTEAAKRRARAALGAAAPRVALS
eukprot:2708415-Prymnesium_polylepis.1